MDVLIFVAIGGLIGLVLGILAAALFLTNRQQGSSDQHDSQSETHEAPPVLKVWLLPPGNRVRLEIAGRRYLQSAAMDPGRQARLEMILNAIIRWLGKPLPVQDEDASARAEAAAPGETGRELADIGPEEDPADIPGGSPWEVVGRALLGETRQSTAGPRSIVAQVDDILQELLMDSPLAGKGIRLIEHPDEGMVILVGLERYQAVEDVPEPEIRVRIKEAVARWEAGSQTE